VALSHLTEAILGALLQKLFQSELRSWDFQLLRSGLPPGLRLVSEEAGRGLKHAWVRGEAGPAQPREQQDPCGPWQGRGPRAPLLPPRSVPERPVARDQFSQQSPSCCQLPLNQEGVGVL